MRKIEADELAVRLTAVGVTATPIRFSERTNDYGYAVEARDNHDRPHVLTHDMGGGYLVMGNPTPARDFAALVGRLLEPDLDHAEKAQALLDEAARSADVLGGQDRATRLIAQAQVHATLATTPLSLDLAPTIEHVGQPLHGYNADAVIGDGEALDRIAAAIASDLGYVETLGEIEVHLRQTGRSVTG